MISALRRRIGEGAQELRAEAGGTDRVLLLELQMRAARRRLHPVHALRRDL